MKIAIGMIVRNLISAYPLTEFLDNAEKYDHPIERVIVVYSHEADPEAIQELQRKAKVSLIRLQNYERAHMILKQLGVRFSSIQQLLFCPLIDTHGLIPYGFNRNHVLMEALFTGVDYLIFVDSDVQPSVLHRTPDGEVGFDEVDFFGAHLYGMSLGATITSSDYSGYNILPPASFEGMTDLLWGLHKEDMAEFWQSSEVRGGLIVQEAGTPELQPTTKVLGGNMGIRMSALTTLPPFFSPYYFYNKTPLLARGEDTLMGLAASRSQIKCLDIGQLTRYLTAFSAALRRALQEFHPDIIHAQHAWCLSWLASLGNLPLVITIHGTDLMGCKKWPAFQSFAEEAVAGSIKVLAISADNRDLALEQFPMAADKLLLLPNGYNEDIFYREEVDRETLFDSLGLSYRGEYVILFVGKLAAFKGVDTLL